MWGMGKNAPSILLRRLNIDVWINSPGGNIFAAAQIYNMISWTPFTFLPVFIAVAGAKHFKCNVYIALWCCMALANPTWGNIAATISEGTALDFLFVPLTSVTYTSSVIPPIILVAILSKLEHWVEPRLPEVVRPIGTPFICAAIMVPMTILVIGPVSTVLSNGLASAYNMLYKFIPWLASGLFGAIWEVLVIFGIHWSFTPISLTNYQNMGFDTLQAFKGIAVCAQVAACFGVDSAAANCEALGYAGNYSNSVIGILIGTAVAVLVTFILVQIVGFDDPVEIPEDIPEADAGEAVSEISEGSSFTVCAPMNGEVKPLSEVPDATFSEGILGQGAAIIPSEGRLYAPFEGTVSSVFDTKHAVCLCGPNGSEMLIHVGLETVTLNGKYFDAKVKDGDKIKTGDLLLEFDLDTISRDFKMITPILITNADDYGEINFIKQSGSVKAGEALYEVQ